MKCKIRLQGSAAEVEATRKYLLKFHPGLILGGAREGTNPKYDGEQKWSSYGDIEFMVSNPRFKKEEVKRKRKGTKRPVWTARDDCSRWMEQVERKPNTLNQFLAEAQRGRK